jgi:hypothetical protein
LIEHYASFPKRSIQEYIRMHLDAPYIQENSMGTDIHIVIQTREVVGYSRDDATIRRLKRAEGAKARLKEYELYSPWQTAARAWHERYYDGKEWVPRRVPEGWQIHVYGNQPWGFDHYISRHGDLGFWDDRHYWVFSALAGVRGRDIHIISEPRGVPEDRGDLDVEHIGDHTFSWLTAREIVANLSNKYRLYGVATNWFLRFGDNCRFVFGFDS